MCVDGLLIFIYYSEKGKRKKEIIKIIFLRVKKIKNRSGEKIDKNRELFLMGYS